MAPDPLTSRGRAAGFWPLLPIAVAVFCMSALVYYHVWEGGTTQARSLLQAAVIGIYEAIGFMPAFLFCGLGLVWSSIWFLGGSLAEPKLRIAKVLGCTVALAIWINLRGAGEVAGVHTGAFGNAIATRLVEAIGFVPSALLLAPLTLVLFLLATDFLFHRHFDELWLPRERKADAARGVAEDGGVGHAETEIFKSLAQAEEAERAAHEAAVAEAAIRETRNSWRGRRRRWRDTEDSHAERADAPLHAETGAVETAGASAVAGSEATSGEIPAVGGFGVEPRDEQANEAVEPPPSPDDDGVGVFARAEGAIAAEIAREPVAGEDPEPGEESRGAVAESVSEADVARELVVGDVDEPVTTAEAQSAADPDVPAEVPDERPFRDQGEPLTEDAAGTHDEWFPTDSGAEGELEAAASSAAQPDVEPVVEIPRPGEDAPRQGSLFGLKRGDDPLVAEAIDLIQQSGRASASFLQRKLRVDFGTASQLLLILAERGVIELDADQSQGRLLR